MFLVIFLKSGEPFMTMPEGDDRERLVCADCGQIAYENPKIVVASSRCSATG